MTWVTTGVVVGGSLLSGIFGKKGAKEQAKSADAATAESRRQFDLTRGDTLPYIQAGHGALDTLSRLEGLYSGAGGTPGTPDMSAFYQSPDYQFNLDQGQQAINRSLAAKGKAISGQGVKAGIDYASGMASNDFGNFVNRLLATAGLGTTGAGQSAAAGAASASAVGNAQMYKGAARASGYDALGNAATSGINNYLFMKYMKQP